MQQARAGGGGSVPCAGFTGGRLRDLVTVRCGQTSVSGAFLPGGPHAHRVSMKGAYGALVTGGAG